MDTFPGFHYYGRKKQLSKHYPEPAHKKIIEPFAGAAAYSCRYPLHDVTLIDADDNIVDTWEYLISASRQDILKLPILKPGESLKNKKFDKLSRGAKLFISFNLGVSHHPVYSPSKLCKWTKEYRDKIADTIHLVSHWKIYKGNYTLQKNCKCTWFIDPPYQGQAGKAYRCGSDMIDYDKLMKWCLGRKGQVIVCEQYPASWLPFEFLTYHNNYKHVKNIELVFLKET